MGFLTVESDRPNLFDFVFPSVDFPSSVRIHLLTKMADIEWVLLPVFSFHSFPPFSPCCELFQLSWFQFFFSLNRSHPVESSLVILNGMWGRVSCLKNTGINSQVKYRSLTYLTWRPFLGPHRLGPHWFWKCPCYLGGLLRFNHPAVMKAFWHTKAYWGEK